MNHRKKWVTMLAGIMAGIMLLSLLLSLLVSTVSAASSSEIQGQIDDLKEQQQQLDDKIQQLEDSLVQNKNDLKSMMERKNVIDQQIALLHGEVTNITQMVSAYNLMIANKQSELDKAEAKLEELNDQYKDRIRAMEERGGLSYWSVIFKASSFSDLLDRLNMILEIAHADQKRMAALRDAAEKVNTTRDELTQEKIRMDLTKVELQNSQATLDSKRAETDKLLTDMKAKGDEYLQMLSESQKEQDQLLQDIVNKEDEYDKAKYEEWLADWLATSVPPTTATTAPSTAPDNIGGGSSHGNPDNVVDGITWYRPINDYWVSDEFGYRVHPITGEWKLHSGIDLAAPIGIPIYATRSGVVTIATYHYTAGNYVKINHNDGYASVYMHMNYFVVEEGDFVTAGQLIGYVGATGGVTGPHLHFSIAYNGVYQNPRNYIRF